ncbi:RagB/SusD family nutrient uptake outer membrane protein [Olivibacter sp. SDN3]|uniref:RagB/SusD family nutrient uptake outer membrane protein n=1 Tax=Olivibacter sp. SDN3 TaxID=2764720 RepID=UPI0016518371|nr:RagB/SusD family nutrient uptake outer membrane protein [Olivibacter sp. SDN3]QNL49581.1 RagB/SusD family nutrient uptake outer membrane protein [Olivibacter sp. SDN3]
MKKCKYMILFAALIIVGCKSSLLETQPYDRIGEEQMWQTEAQAIMGINAIYNNLRDENVYREYYMLDCLSPYAYGYDRLEQEMAGTATTFSATYTNKWRELYKGIQRANDALFHIPAMETVDPTLKDRLIGEAYFLRALHYFNLLDFYGSVPIYEEPIAYDEAFNPRNTVEEVRAFIRADLDAAETLLPATYSASEFGRATKGAAIALRGKLALYAGDWQSAEEDFKTVMGMDYSLHPVYSELFRSETERNSEVIFSIQNVAVQGLGENLSFRLGTRATRGSCWTNGVPSPILVDSYEMEDGSPFVWDNVISGYSNMSLEERDALFRDPDVIKTVYEGRDPRLQQTIITPYADYLGANNVTYTLAWPFVNDIQPYFHIRHNWNANALYLWRKFVSIGDESLMREDGPIDFPVIRLADVLLMYAEARNESLGGPDNEVFNAINQVRQRAGMPELQNSDGSNPTYVANKEEMRERIRKERAVELATEGVSYSDVRRWKIAQEVCNGPILEFTTRVLKERVFTARDYLWPIPQAEVDQNDQLEQNPGWQ